MSPRDAPKPGRSRADELVRFYGRTLGVHDARLDANDDRSFGEIGFHYDSATDQLTVRLYIAKAYIDSNTTPENLEAYRHVARTLNDPAIGGLFENGQGVFVLNEDKGMYFLTRAFSVPGTTASDLAEAMDYLLGLAARWRIQWFGKVADIAHGRESPPQQRVTLTDSDE